MRDEQQSWHWIVRGRVQGVSYRWFTREAARALGLTGFVRNQADGTVEVQVEGPAETIERFRRRLLEGPPHARVAGIDEQPLATPLGVEGFEIRFL